MNMKLSATALPTMDITTFREAMSHVAAAVHVITTNGAAGRAGFTASAVCSVSDSPASLLVCLNRNASVFDYFQAHQVLCVNTLSSSQQNLAQRFGGKTPMTERFLEGEWHTLLTGSPVLKTALVAFDCVIQHRYSVGSHDILVCQVQAIQHGVAQSGLLYAQRQYCESVPMAF